MDPEASGPAAAATGLGREFAEALAAKDFGRIAGLLDPEIDFGGLTPRRTWEANSATQAIDEILTTWLDESDHVDELVSVETGTFADRSTLSYALRGHNEDGPFTFEQRAYFTEHDGRIDWMRVLCSGFRPLD